MKAPDAAILIIGNEILSGRVQDANIRFIAERLGLRGIKLSEVRVVRDEESAVVAAVRALSAAYTYVFSTGGIGPTHDDITADCMARAFNVEIGIDPAAREMLRAYYAERNIELTPGRLRMARIPQGAALIKNPVSGAPGFKISNVYVMAGVPSIMQGMLLGFEEELASGEKLLSNTVTARLRESEIAFELEEIQKQHPGIEIGSYPTMGHSVSLVLRGADKAALKTATEKIAALARRHDAEGTTIVLHTE